MSKIVYLCGTEEKQGKLSGISRSAQSLIQTIVDMDKEYEYEFWGNDELALPIKMRPFFPTDYREKIFDCYMDLCGADIIHSFCDSNFFNKPKEVKTILTVNDLFPLVNANWADKPELLYRYFDINYRENTRYVDKFIAISEATKNDILHYYPHIKEEQIEVIYLGNEEKLDIKCYKEDITTAKYGVGDGYILSVNTLMKRKNLEGVLKAFEQYCQLHPTSKLKFVVTGQIMPGNKVYQKLQESKFRDRVVLTGYVSDEELLSLYCNAVAVVYASFYEGFGLPILEAMSLGKAVISSNTSSMPEVGGDAVHYCDPYDIESITNGIEQICEKEIYRKELESKAIERAKLFSYEKAARETLELYSKIM